MKIEKIIGYWLVQGRTELGLTQADVGERLGEYLGKPWARQSISAAEKGDRAFTAAELVAFAMVFGSTVETLIEPPPGVDSVDLGGEQPLDARHLRITTSTNTDLAGLLHSMQQVRDQVPNVQNQVRELDALVRRAARDAWDAARGRGLQVADEQKQKERGW